MSFIKFAEVKDSKRKTKQFCIMNTTNMPCVLGYISFYPQWRKFVFFPNKEIITLFDDSCLREIANFCEDQSREWRKEITNAKRNL